jgi:hypothetical protein
MEDTPNGWSTFWTLITVLGSIGSILIFYLTLWGRMKNSIYPLRIEVIGKAVVDGERVIDIPYEKLYWF